MATGFPFSRSIITIESHRTVKSTGKTSIEKRYYLSSQPADQRTPEEWINLTRSHWAGVENRNHWRRDATQGEDRTRLQNSRALINLALLRSVNLRLLSNWPQSDNLPAQMERLAANPSLSLGLLKRK
jgi:predicted transposase YbfD/YdcC|tara:strand:+ start:1160 stop:1543 length:384 start_codon:yes stop_codon:yes gene_type:complete